MLTLPQIQHNSWLDELMKRGKKAENMTFKSWEDLQGPNVSRCIILMHCNLSKWEISILISTMFCAFKSYDWS